MIRLLYSQTQVSDGEARAAALHRLEEVEIAFVALDIEQLPPDLGADETAALAYLSANQGAVRAAYEAETDAYAIAERVRASHILFRLEPDADETAADVARELAEAALARLQAGEDFAEIAGEQSEDPGTRDQGGDLGTFGKGDRRPELEQAAFALEPGQLSEIVRTDAGLHIIRLDERLEAGRKSFDEVSTEIARELADAELARERADLASQQLATAIREGQSLESAARGLELPIERPDPLRRRADGFITGLGVAPELMAAIFALTREQPSSDRIFQAGTKLVLVQLLSRPELEPAALEEVIASERTRLLNLKRDQAVQDWIDFDRRTLADSGRLRIDSSPVTGS
jgi:peptidyl-prolyl cis-trans isomerase D